MKGNRPKELHLGVCITGHGYGHAARAVAVLAALAGRVRLRCTLLTTVPEEFFRVGPDCSFVYHRFQTDVGLVQRTGLSEDLPATLDALDGFYPLQPDRVDRAARLLAGCSLVLCDIAPLGIVVAERLGVPSLVVENFTWDWIYQAYLEQCPGLERYIEIMAGLFARATVHVQAEPVCRPVAGARRVSVVYRPPRLSRDRVRKRLKIGQRQPVILVTMGGVGGDEPDRAVLAARPDLFFLLAGQEVNDRYGNVIRLTRSAPWYHPDLVAAADALVGKAGYSTLAEAWGGRTPFAHVGRPVFPEAPVLARFIREKELGLEIAAPDLADGSWLDCLDRLLSWPLSRVERVNGAEAVADLVLETLGISGG